MESRQDCVSLVGGAQSLLRAVAVLVVVMVHHVCPQREISVKLNAVTAHIIIYV
jgi:hypothetical protein